MTPAWVTLVVAVVAAGGALSGVMITQRREDRRDVATRAHELDRERERWRRDDEQRTFEERRKAYVEFLESLRDMAFVVYNFGLGLGRPDDLAEGWQLPTFRRLDGIELYAPPAVSSAALTAYSKAWWWGHSIEFECAHNEEDMEFYELQEEYDNARGLLMDLIRRDLAVPVGLEDAGSEEGKRDAGGEEGERVGTTE